MNSTLICGSECHSEYLSPSVIRQARKIVVQALQSQRQQPGGLHGQTMLEMWAQCDSHSGSQTAVSALDETSALAIFLAKANHNPRDSTSAILAAKHGITMKAVRDVWNLRTWAWTTLPHWSREDHKLFLKKSLCAECRSKGVHTLDGACKAGGCCSVPRRRGRPMVDADTSAGKALANGHLSQMPGRQREATAFALKIIPGPTGACTAAVDTAHGRYPSASDWRMLDHTALPMAPRWCLSSAQHCERQEPKHTGGGTAPCRYPEHVQQNYRLAHPNTCFAPSMPSMPQEHPRRHHVPQALDRQREQEHYESPRSAARHVHGRALGSGSSVTLAEYMHDPFLHRRVDTYGCSADVLSRRNTHENLPMEGCMPNALPHSATHCDALQHTLQHTATHCMRNGLDHAANQYMDAGHTSCQAGLIASTSNGNGTIFANSGPDPFQQHPHYYSGARPDGPKQERNGPRHSCSHPTSVVFSSTSSSTATQAMHLPTGAYHSSLLAHEPARDIKGACSTSLRPQQYIPPPSTRTPHRGEGVEKERRGEEYSLLEAAMQMHAAFGACP